METNVVNKFLLISIDCWRYDALGRTNPLLNTPKFDLLTQDFSLAEKFFVSAPATRPSHTSYFTGLYPFEHGVYGQTYLKMFEGIPNLFQIFSDAGGTTSPDVPSVRMCSVSSISSRLLHRWIRTRQHNSSVHLRI